MARSSAGLLMYRRREGRLEVLLVHPGGPYWVHKDLGAWSVPKGEYADEPPLEAAKREFREELGHTPSGTFIELAPVRQRGGKTVRAWAFEADFDPSRARSVTFTVEWPPGSGSLQDFPEVDRAEWCDLDEARQRILRSQVPLLDELASLVDAESGAISPGDDPRLREAGPETIVEEEPGAGGGSA